MKVAVLKGFPLAIDQYGVKTRDLVAGTVDDVPDDIAPSLVDEGYVSLKLGDLVTGDGSGEALTPIGVGNGEKVAEAVEIPADWQKAHHKTRVALAKKITGVDGLTTEQADKIIADELLRRSGPAPSSGDE